MKKITKYILAFLMLITINLPLLASADILDSGVLEDIDKLSDYSAVAYDANTNKDSMAQIIADVIKVFLGLLGVIFVILIVVAGYNWMTAGGNEEKVAKGQKLISRAIIGLVIIVTAYAVTYWIFARLPSGDIPGQNIKEIE